MMDMFKKFDIAMTRIEKRQQKELAKKEAHIDRLLADAEKRLAKSEKRLAKKLAAQEKACDDMFRKLDRWC